MKPSNSITIVKRGSDSEEDDEEKSVVTIAILTVLQSIINFFIFLTGCDIGKYQLISGILPLVTSVSTSFLFVYSIVHKSSFSVRPFIAYHLIVLCSLGFFVILFIFILLLHRLPPFISSILHESLLPFQSFQQFVSSLTLPGRFLYCFFLLLMVTFNLISLHISTSFYVFLE
ncbi:hypothetical protein PRIPAC_70176, partial [Pristionchus pacificus]|uniref:Uncharacterized protein n=1 Tax=Pristionchus pacificus TaxID=54126 RepID=A0A2A6BFG0_PRIPA